MKNKLLDFLKNAIASLLLFIVALLLFFIISISSVLAGIIVIPVLIYGFCKGKEQWIANK